MRRDTLATFIRNAVLATLPLAGLGCANSPGPGPIPCGGGSYTVTLDGGLGDGGCQAKCGTFVESCEERSNSAGLPVVDCTDTRPCLGRRPEGLVSDGDGSRDATGASALGQHFAAAAHLEAASVPAFRRLRAELRAHGAPRRLIDACTRAARDEIRHARSAARLARRFGATRPPVRLLPARPRSLMALAVENAREGCVGESFAALLASFQAATAADPDVRAHLTSIAGDETRHAELAWEIDAWLRTRLPPRERAHLAAVRADELARLAATLEAPADAELQRAAGLPAPAAARALYRAFAFEVARRA
jgi:hypothetical protein